MKKMTTVLITSIGIALAGVAFAGSTAQTKDGYFTSLSKDKAPTVKNNSRAFKSAPTDIPVVNITSLPIHMNIDGTGIDDFVAKNTVDRITNFNGSYYTGVTLRDHNYNYIWSDVVCPQAIITLIERSGRHFVTVDRQFC